MSDQTWYFIDGSETPYGPVTTPQLHAFVASGNILPETQVWTKSFGQQWIPAINIAGLFTAAPVTRALVTPSLQTMAPTTNPGPAVYTNPTPMGTMPITSNTPITQPITDAPHQVDNILYPATIKNGGSVGLWCISLFGGLLTIMLGSLILGISPTSLDIKTSGAALYISLGIISIGCILVLFSVILPYIYIYKAWKCLQPGGATISPGKSIGFLFIPLFNIYWFFKAIIGLPKQWNSITSSYQNTKYAPKLTIGALIFMFLVPIIGHIIWLIEISKGLNFMVALHSQHSTSINNVLAEKRNYLSPK